MSTPSGILAYELLTGATPFTGDTALAVAYQRMDNDVAPPSTVIGGVPAQFDELVLRATARDPADRYADADEMAAELDAIVDELGLPDFRVPAPRNSAQHLSATVHRSRVSQHDHRRANTSQARQAAAPAHPGADPWTRRLAARRAGRAEYSTAVAGQFAGIDDERVLLGPAARQAHAVVLGGRRAGAHRAGRRRRMDDRQQPDRLV